MTQTKKIAVLDCSAQRMFTTHLEHNTSNDLEVDVDTRLSELGFNLDECSWMEVQENTEMEEVEDAYLDEVQDFINN